MSWYSILSGKYSIPENEYFLKQFTHHLNNRISLSYIKYLRTHMQQILNLAPKGQIQYDPNFFSFKIADAEIKRLLSIVKLNQSHAKIIQEFLDRAVFNKPLENCNKLQLKDFSLRIEEQLNVAIEIGSPFMVARLMRAIKNNKRRGGHLQINLNNIIAKIKKDLIKSDMEKFYLMYIIDTDVATQYLKDRNI